MNILTFLEALEPRIAPATLVNLLSASTASYTEADGDHVTVKFSKKVFTDIDNTDLQDAFTFDNTTGKLQLLDLTALNSALAEGTSITFKVTKDRVHGDGFANVDEINTDTSLGAVKGIHNLGALTIDNSHSAALALKSLSVDSMVWNSDISNFFSDIQGNIGTITIKGDFSDSALTGHGSIKTLTVGGDIIGGDNPNTGFHFDSAKTIKVGSLIGLGSAMDDSARIIVEHNVSSLTTGDIIGGDGESSGNVWIGGLVATAKVGAITGGSGHSSGSFSSGDVGKITAASITNGTDDFAGGIFIQDHEGESSITVTGNLDGTANDHSLIFSAGNIKTLSVGGDVINAAVAAKNFGDVKISGDVSTNSSASGFSLGIHANNSLKSFSASGITAVADHVFNIDAGGEAGDGYTKTGEAIGSISIAGDVTHAFINAGYFISTNHANDNARLTSVSVGGDWTASSIDVGINEGNDTTLYTNDDFIQGTSHLGSLTIKGSISGTNQAGENYGIRASVFDKLVFGKTTIDAIAAYAVNTPIALSPESDGTPGNGAVFIERGLPDPTGGTGSGTGDA